MKSIYLRKSKQNGSVLVSILVVTLFLTTVISAFIVLAGSNLTRARSRVMLLQAQYAAESGADSAIAIFNDGNTSYTGSSGEVEILESSQYRSTFEVSVAAGSDDKEKIVTATGRVYAPSTDTTADFVKTIEVIAKRSSTESSTSLLSRNIIDIQSGVKNIYATDVTVNGFIYMHKNTTNLVAENITVADKDTSAANCSIGGTGNLVKPSSFSDPSQTKTNLLLAYNNCISPPGNTTNANFNVSANIGTISKVQSTNIPWSQFMDNSYQNSAGGCNDWTTGSSPRSIPSTGNTKKTHYPDSSSGVSSSCGSSGSLNLGTNQYDILDHVHLRANLCATADCNPIFNNPGTDIRFIFVEGSIKFDSIRTASGSGPIVFVASGADPSSLTSVCPYGGSIYVGQGPPSGYTNAPDLYFLAANGVCLDKTKFGASPALGGISGKNIYVASSSGTPFDLRLDPSFPTSQIPIDLSWRAARYRIL